MNGKSQARQRRSRRSRIQMRELGQTRLCVHRTSRHIYAQVIDGTGSQVLAQASTLDETLRDTNTGNKEAAAKVGSLIGERATAAGITNVAFDRSGFKYHGRVKSLAEAAREKGLVF